MLLGIHLENPDRIDVTDPICDEFFIYFGQVALKNALIYEEVFGTVPTNRVRTFAQSKEYNEAKYMKDIDPKQVCTFESIFRIYFFKLCFSFILGSRKAKKYSRFRCRISSLLSS